MIPEEEGAVDSQNTEEEEELTIMDDVFLDDKTVEEKEEEKNVEQAKNMKRSFNRKKDGVMTHFQKKLLEKIDEDKKTAADVDDADKQFLLSILPDYKKLNDDGKLDFRLLVLNFFRDVRKKNSIPQQSSPPPTYNPNPYNTAYYNQHHSLHSDPRSTMSTSASIPYSQQFPRSSQSLPCSPINPLSPISFTSSPINPAIPNSLTSNLLSPIYHDNEYNASDYSPNLSRVSEDVQVTDE